MNIGIIINSETGNTYKVAEKIKEKITANGNTVDIQKVNAAEEVKPGSTIKLKTNPSIKNYDAVIFGGPVVAFSLTPVMKTYISGIDSLQNKKVACFVTKQLPFNWTGGNQAIKSMKNKCKNKNADIIKTGIIIWGKQNTDRSIDLFTDELSKLF